MITETHTFQNQIKNSSHSLNFLKNTPKPKSINLLQYWLNLRNSSCIDLVSSSSTSVFASHHQSSLQTRLFKEASFMVDCDFARQELFQSNLIASFNSLKHLVHLFEVEARKEQLEHHCHYRYVIFSSVTILQVLRCVLQSIERRLW